MALRRFQRIEISRFKLTYKKTKELHEATSRRRAPKIHSILDPRAFIKYFQEVILRSWWWPIPWSIIHDLDWADQASKHNSAGAYGAGVYWRLACEKLILWRLNYLPNKCVHWAFDQRSFHHFWFQSVLFTMNTIFFPSSQVSQEGVVPPGPPNPPLDTSVTQMHTPGGYT